MTDNSKKCMVDRNPRVIQFLLNYAQQCTDRRPLMGCLCVLAFFLQLQHANVMFIF